MKLRLAVKIDDSENVVFVEVPQGVYMAYFNAGQVEYTREKMMMQKFIDSEIYEIDFCKEDLVDSTEFRGVKYYPCINLKLANKQVIMEYLDISSGDIPPHKNFKNVREAYMSLDTPYTGKVFGYEEEHEACTNHIVAVRIIDLNS